MSKEMLRKSAVPVVKLGRCTDGNTVDKGQNFHLYTDARVLKAPSGHNRHKYVCLQASLQQHTFCSVSAEHSFNTLTKISALHPKTQIPERNNFFTKNEEIRQTISHTINCNQHLGGFQMGFLSNCGGGNSCWIIILLLLCCCGCGNGNGSGVGGGNTCDCNCNCNCNCGGGVLGGTDSGCIWIIVLLLIFCGSGSGVLGGGNCNCSCNCNNNCTPCC